MAQEKPYPEFPLFRHQNGQWAKKIRGKLRYFGTDWQEALSEYYRVVDDLQAGREPMPRGEALTILELVNRFLDAKMTLVESNELSIRTWQTYKATSETICEVLGREVAVVQLRPADFDRLRMRLAAVRGAVALGNEIQRVRSIFKYAHEAGLIPHPLTFGPHFKKPSRKVVRQQRQANGKRMFSAAEIRKLFYAADRPVDRQLRAAILLGINCGFGQSDISNLPFSAILGNWIEFPRPKTAVERRCPLWPETRDALDEVIRHRREPRLQEHRDLIFLTRLGQPWVRASAEGVPIDQLGKRFTKLLTDCSIRRPGVNFYALRHTLETIGGEAKDQIAVDWIMGHVTPGMGTNYRHLVSDERLFAVTETVRNWLFPRPFVG